MVTMPEPQRLINARRFFLSYSKEHLEDAVHLLSPHVVYSVPGHSGLTSMSTRPDEVRRHIVKLIDFSQGTFEILKWTDWMIGETHIAALQYAQAPTRGRIYTKEITSIFSSSTRTISCLPSGSTSKIKPLLTGFSEKTS